MISPFILRQAASLYHQGGILAYPTEAVYGLGCDPLNEQAVRAILLLKNRPVEKGLILIASDLEQLQPYVKLSTAQRNRILKQSTPVTWLVSKSPLTPPWLSGAHEKLAIRVTRHADARDLCRAVGHPLVSTSANPGAHPAARSRIMVQHYFGDAIDMIVPGELGGEKKPTEIRDIETDRVVRAG